MVYDSRAQAGYLDNLHLACTRRMYLFFRIRCPGARSDSSASIALRTDVVNFVYSSCWKCLRAFIGNGLQALVGKSIAKEIMVLKSMWASCISQTGAWLEKRLRAYRLDKVPLREYLKEEEWLF